MKTENKILATDLMNMYVKMSGNKYDATDIEQCQKEYKMIVDALNSESTDTNKPLPELFHEIMAVVEIPAEYIRFH